MSRSYNHFLPFGLKNGLLVDVNAVPRGKACDCICPACNMPLLTRKGDSKRHHFAHDPDFRTEDCKFGYETALHLMAKQIIEESGHILLPGYSVTEFFLHRQRGRISETVDVLGDHTLLYNRVELEQTQQDTRPDIVIYIDGEPLFVEVAVTHFVDDEKRQKLVRMNVMAIEIDLSKLDRFPSKDELRAHLIDALDSKTWLNHPAANEIKRDIRERKPSGLPLINRDPNKKWTPPPRDRDPIAYDLNPRTLEKIYRVKPKLPPLPEGKKTLYCRDCRHVFEVNVNSQVKVCPLCRADL